MKIMKDFEKQSEIMDMKEEIINDLLFKPVICNLDDSIERLLDAIIDDSVDAHCYRILGENLLWWHVERYRP